jgi:hypothetical protein
MQVLLMFLFSAPSSLDYSCSIAFKSKTVTTVRGMAQGKRLCAISGKTA